jgi:hypothetical protein
MPISRRKSRFNPVDSPQPSTVIRFERAKHACERCGRPHLKVVRHLGDGRWWDADLQSWRDGNGRRVEVISAAMPECRSTKVVLVTVHLDHDPLNNRPQNRAALCQRCHMLHYLDGRRQRR